jgi:hypothetical protein
MVVAAGIVEVFESSQTGWKVDLVSGQEHRGMPIDGHGEKLIYRHSLSIENIGMYTDLDPRGCVSHPGRFEDGPFHG